VFEGDFWGEIVAEFSHSLGQKRSLTKNPEVRTSQVADYDHHHDDDSSQKGICHTILSTV
jgi:hypothetical protein